MCDRLRDHFSKMGGATPTISCALAAARPLKLTFSSAALRIAIAHRRSAFCPLLIAAVHAASASQFSPRGVAMRLERTLRLCQHCMNATM